MASIMIISGCLGTGKTTLSTALAHATPAGLHLCPRHRCRTFYGPADVESDAGSDAGRCRTGQWAAVVACGHVEHPTIVR